MAWEEEAGTGLSIAHEVAAKQAAGGNTRAAELAARLQAQRRTTGLQPVHRGVAPNPRAGMAQPRGWPQPPPPPARRMTPFESWQDLQSTNPKRTITSFDDLMGIGDEKAEEV